MSHTGVRTIEALQRLNLETLLSARRHVMLTTPPWQTPWGTLVDHEVILEQPLAAAAADDSLQSPCSSGRAMMTINPIRMSCRPTSFPKTRGR